ncbi:alpha/beta-hydrolase [Sarocladium strictum]
MKFPNVPSIDVLTTPAVRPDHEVPAPSSRILPAGHRRNERSRPLEVDMLTELNQVLTMRDGVRLRADIYRPTTAEPVPAVIMYSPYGKSGSGFFNLNKFPLRAGIAEAKLSAYESFEGLDPAEWVPKRYAIINVDNRGTGESEGVQRCWGIGEGQDGYDAVEEIARLSWCNGKVAMAGNSWLATSQYFIAAAQPPHLACIAPMEGISDLFREHVCRGGIPITQFVSPLTSTFIGRGDREDLSGMVEKFPMINEYWEDKRARMDLIKVPSYIIASYSTGLHCAGSFRAFEEIGTNEKWLSVHATQEWYDLYTKERTDDVQCFFDRFMKDAQNGWEDTPTVRYSFLQFPKPAATNVPFSDLPWNLAETSTNKLFLSPEGGLQTTSPAKAAQVKYQADAPSQNLDNDPGEVVFSHTFWQATRLTGPATAVLYVASPDHNDLDIFVQIRKANKNGKILQCNNMPLSDLGVSSISEVPSINPLKYLGPQGMLRASQRAVSQDLSKASKTWKTLAQDREEFVPKGEVVRLEIQLWPAGLAFEAGEQLALKVSGHNMVLPEFEVMPPYANCNKGEHIIQTGGDKASHLQFYTI